MNFPYSNRILIKTLFENYETLFNKTIRIGAIVKTGREAGSGENTWIFLEVNDGSCFESAQLLITKEVTNDISFKKLTPCGTSIYIEGIVSHPPEGVKQLFEIKTTKLLYFGICDNSANNYPFAKKKQTLEYLRENPHLRARTNVIGAMSRIRSKLAYATHKFFQEKNFIFVNTPILTNSDCEGAGELFEITKPDNFFGTKTYLTCSGQLNGEYYASCLSNIYTFGPTFRAEKSNTSRHLAEFQMIEPEMAFCDINGAIQCAEDYVKYCCTVILEECSSDLSFFNKIIDNTCIERLKTFINTPFTKLSYTNAIDILIKSNKNFEVNVVWGIDLGSEHEKYLTDEIYKNTLVLYDYPKNIKPFYMKLNEDQMTVGAFDVLVPRIGELIGGSQREENLNILTKNMKSKNMKIEEYKYYIDIRKYGSIPHSGFGLGFERLVMFVTGLTNIRDVIPFPRYPGHID